MPFFLSFRRPSLLVCGASMDGTFLPEADWHDLLGEIYNHQVIPIVGPEMATVREPFTGISIPLYRALAPKLAAALGVPTNGAPATSLNRVACDYLLSGGARKAIYREVAELLERMEFTPPPALCELASITDFDIFISGTIDPLLAIALEGARSGFQRREHVRVYEARRAECGRSREADIGDVKWFEKGKWVLADNPWAGPPQPHHGHGHHHPAGPWDIEVLKKVAALLFPPPEASAARAAAPAALSAAQPRSGEPVPYANRLTRLQ